MLRRRTRPVRPATVLREEPLLYHGDTREEAATVSGSAVQARDWSVHEIALIAVVHNIEKR